MIIEPEKIKRIIAILRDNGDDNLTKEFRAIVAMARNRQQAKNEIDSQSIPIFLHLIPFTILTNKGLQPPIGWKSEIRAFFGSIDAKNSGKSRLWFSDEQIQNMLDETLNSKIKNLLLNKIEKFRGKQPLYKVLITEINDFFNKNKKLKDIGIEIKYIKVEKEFLLSLFIKNKKIF